MPSVVWRAHEPSRRLPWGAAPPGLALTGPAILLRGEARQARSAVSQSPRRISTAAGPVKAAAVVGYPSPSNQAYRHFSYRTDEYTS